MNIDEARQVREDRAAVLRGLQDQTLWVEDVILNPPECMVRCRVGTMLLAARHIGEGRLEDILGGYGAYGHVGLIPPEDKQRIINRLPNAARKKVT